jgi:hypothetical protein
MNYPSSYRDPKIKLLRGVYESCAVQLGFQMVFAWLPQLMRPETKNRNWNEKLFI